MQTITYEYAHPEAILEDTLRRIRHYEQKIQELESTSSELEQYRTLLGQYTALLEKTAVIGTTPCGKTAFKLFDSIEQALDYRRNTDDMDVELIADFPEMSKCSATAYHTDDKRNHLSQHSTDSADTTPSSAPLQDAATR